MEIFLNREMINFRAVTGALQMQLRHFNREDLPLLRSFTEERGDRVIEYDAPGIRGIMPNLEYPGDPVVRGLLQNRHLRIALSLAIDRELINHLCYGGSGKPASPPDPGSEGGSPGGVPAPGTAGEGAPPRLIFPRPPLHAPPPPSASGRRSPRSPGARWRRRPRESGWPPGCRTRGC